MTNIHKVTFLLAGAMLSSYCSSGHQESNKAENTAISSSASNAVPVQFSLNEVPQELKGLYLRFSDSKNKNHLSMEISSNFGETKGPQNMTVSYCIPGEKTLMNSEIYDDWIAGPQENSLNYSFSIECKQLNKVLLSLKHLGEKKYQINVDYLPFSNETTGEDEAPVPEKDD